MFITGGNKRLKKHIIIAGVPRAGKSTISQEISKRYGYQHISMDSVIAGIERVFPETGVDSDANVPELDNLYYISNKIALFIRAMMDSGEYEELDYGMVIDVYQLLPQDYVKNIDQSICDIFYFVTADVTPEERFEILKKYDTLKDYTFYKSDDENKSDCISIVEISKVLKEQCEQYKLPCFETSRKRNTIIDEFIKSIQ